MNEILKISNVSYIYGKGTPFEKKALKNVSVSFEKGKITYYRLFENKWATDDFAPTEKSMSLTLGD